MTYFINAVFQTTLRSPKNTFIAYKYLCVTSRSYKSVLDD